MTDERIKELKEKKITMEQAFLFQEILEKIKIEDVGEHVLKLIENIRKNTVELTEYEEKQLEEIDKIKDEKEKKKKLLIVKNKKTIETGIKVNTEVKNYILKHLFKVKKDIKELVMGFTGDTIIDMDDMFNIFNIMWDIGLFKLVFIHLQNKELYVKKK